VIKPDPLHMLLTPLTNLEKAVPFSKGGFSFRVKKDVGSSLEIWQKGFSDHRIRDVTDHRMHARHIRQDPVRKHLCERAKNYAYSSAGGRFELDGAPEGAPFQN
jgi:putative transposase